MLSKEDAVQKPHEELYSIEEAEIARLLEYDQKIDKILRCILTDKEARVFELRIGSRWLWADIARESKLPESTIRAIFGKIERKLEAFRALFNLA